MLKMTKRLTAEQKAKNRKLIPFGRPTILSDPAKAQQLIDNYFATNENVTICGLALALGFSTRETLYDYACKPDFSDIINKARLRVEAEYENKLSTQTCTGSIFALKNMGWKDKTEVDQNVKAEFSLRDARKELISDIQAAKALKNGSGS